MRKTVPKTSANSVGCKTSETKFPAQRNRESIRPQQRFQFAPNRELIRDNRESIPPGDRNRKTARQRSARPEEAHATSLAVACYLASTPTPSCRPNCFFRHGRAYPVERRAFFRTPYLCPTIHAPPLPANPKPGVDQFELPFFTMVALEQGRAASPNRAPNGPISAVNFSTSMSRPNRRYPGIV
jgi:hypothetical protein